MPRAFVLPLVLVAAGLLAACAVGGDDRELQYVVVPHPDDEYQGWGLVTGRDDTYPVFVLLTKGELSQACDGSAFQPEYGERAPQPQPFVGDDPERCAAQRVDAWHVFLDGMAELEGWGPDTADAVTRTGVVAAAFANPA